MIIRRLWGSTRGGKSLDDEMRSFSSRRRALSLKTNGRASTYFSIKCSINHAILSWFVVERPGSPSLRRAARALMKNPEGAEATAVPPGARGF